METRSINLKSGEKVLVDDLDFDVLSQHKWHLSGGYARRSSNGELFLMHRQIMNPPKNMFIDHINGNKLDNTRKNLRLATNAQNQANTNKTVAISGFRGVYPQKHGTTWIARITRNYRRITVGNFKTKEDASLAYNKAKKEMHGEFAKLN